MATVQDQLAKRWTYEEEGMVLGAQAGEKRLAEIFKKAGFGTFRRATATPFNLVLEALL